jgi:excisionase family DNA binding protein
MDPIKNYLDENNVVCAALIELMRPLILEAVERAIQDLNSQPTQQAARPLSIEEAAQFCKCSKHTLYRKTAAGTIPHFRQGNRLLFDETELLEWLKSGRLS